MQNRQNHQVRIREKPLFGFSLSGLSRARNLPKMPISRQASQMIEADAGQARHFVFRKELLTRLDSDHLRSLRAQMLHAR
jgi:hypothetical protein